jgi:hypothetical protein
MPLSAGDLVASAGQRMVALSAADSEGFVRFAPVVAADKLGEAIGFALDVADFESGGTSGWLRLDRVGWQFIDNWQPLGSLKPKTLARVHRALCAREARTYADLAIGAQTFVPGRTPVPPAGKVIGARELELMVEASLDGWLTAGRFNDAFERKLSAYLGRKFTRTTNSGSSARSAAGR